LIAASPWQSTAESNKVSRPVTPNVNTAKLAFIRDIYIDQHVGTKILPEVSLVPQTDNPLALVSYFFLYKSIKTLDAICVLGESGHAEDALVLGRTIFELSMYLHWMASPDTVEERRLRAESFIYDGDRQRVVKLKEVEALKKQGKCLSWISEIEALNPVFEIIPMPTSFTPLKNLKDMAAELGDEWEGWYHFLYWSASKVTHPSGIGSHSYFQEVDQGEEVSRALTVGLTMHFFLTSAALSLVGLEKFRSPLEEAMQQFVALSAPPQL
jgi:uncharacterized protein DUF5677